MKKLYLPNTQSYSKKRDTELYQTSLQKGYKKKLKELAGDYGYKCINYFLEDMADASLPYSKNIQEELDYDTLKRKIIDNYVYSEKGIDNANDLDLLCSLVELCEDEYITEVKFIKIPYTTRELSEKLNYSRTHISNILRLGGFVYLQSRKAYYAEEFKKYEFSLDKQ